MCTSPILIKNRRYGFLDVKMPTSFVHVPCGHCDECLRKRAKDLYLRSRFEIEDAVLNGGSAFMCCLTYGTKLAPTLEHLGTKHYVFNKKHVIDFIKRLRTNLDRFFRTNYNCDAPDFKYLVTSEFGTDPTRSHLPHYHLLFSFAKQISYFAFRHCFIQSMRDRRTGKSVFGHIFQCDPLDLKKGGIRYTSKYVLKDQTYSYQDKIINERIKFFSDYVNNKYGIVIFPQNDDEVFRNKCIRSSKEYKRDVETMVLPYRHMLQFYMCSNDFGVSSLLKRYGENLFSLGMLNIDGFAYSIPKQVLQRLERTEGSEKRDIIAKRVFMEQFRSSVNDCVNSKKITSFYGEQLYKFAEQFLQPRYGFLYFVSPSGKRYWDSIVSPLHAYYDALEDSYIYSDNDFYGLRDAVYNVISMSNCSSNLEIRAQLARERTCKEKREYEKKKFNNPSNY